MSLTQTLAALHDQAVENAEGLVDEAGGPLCASRYYSTGLQMLTPSEPIAVTNASQANVVSRGLRLIASGADEEC